MITLILVGLAFVLGSVPSGLLVGLVTAGLDVRMHGSGNIGASNVTDVAGWKAGMAVAALDILKGVMPVAIGSWYGLGAGLLAPVALAAVLGHDFSLFLRFRGGKGVATTFGVMLVLAPGVTLLDMALWAIALLITGYASAASLVALAVSPLLLALSGQPGDYVSLALALFCLGAAKHRANIARLWRGQEPGLK